MEYRTVYFAHVQEPDTNIWRKKIGWSKFEVATKGMKTNMKSFSL